ncbi:hypothetical protein LZ31DRAFT_19768 [Colletotrichum somersetense]|nr:hypothetical protein LZ31DRAFT_19768 [Colletotrichum somersetense]
MYWAISVSPWWLRDQQQGDVQGQSCPHGADAREADVGENPPACTAHGRTDGGASGDGTKYPLTSTSIWSSAEADFTRPDAISTVHSEAVRSRGSPPPRHPSRRDLGTRAFGPLPWVFWRPRRGYEERGWPPGLRAFPVKVAGCYTGSRRRNRFASSIYVEWLWFATIGLWTRAQTHSFRNHETRVRRQTPGCISTNRRR